MRRKKRKRRRRRTTTTRERGGGKRTGRGGRSQQPHSFQECKHCQTFDKLLLLLSNVC